MQPPNERDPINVFDRRQVRRNRDRAAPGLDGHDFLFREIAGRLAERLDDIKRTFPLALDLGSHGGVLRGTLKGRGGIETLIETDLSPAMAARAGAGLALAADEEALPFANGSFDIVLSCFSLHWVNDLPGTLAQIRRVLKPDGLLLAALAGGGTLAELRHALLDAEGALEGGAGPRTAPFAGLGDAAGLLTRAGFALPVADGETLTVSYGDALALMRDLRAMGEANAVHGRRSRFTRRGTLFAAAARYAELYGDGEGRIPATFEIAYLTAWAPAGGQPKALAPGSAETKLADALGVAEKSAGEKPGGG